MIIEGYFTKMIYTDNVITLNGLYINCPLSWYSTGTNSRVIIPNEGGWYYENTLDDSSQKIVIHFSFTEQNIRLVEELSRIEHEIIEHYKDFFKINKTNIYYLKNQLKTGSFRPFFDTFYFTHPIDVSSNLQEDVMTKKRLYLKISGVWETETNIGITYKFYI